MHIKWQLISSRLRFQESICSGLIEGPQHQDEIADSNFLYEYLTISVTEVCDVSIHFPHDVTIRDAT